MNDQVLVLLDQIDPNPYQPRHTEDAVAVQELADSIVRNGLLQTPTARKANGRYQLAFGHTRLATFRQLAGVDPQYGLMPLNVQELSDLQMFELAVAENIQRRDLNPIEQAEAMRVYMTTFDKNSVETGAFFNVSPETVRGTVRLNDLAPAAKDALRAGKITVGIARSLLSMQKVAPVKAVEQTLQQINREAGNTVPEEVIENTIDQLENVVELWNDNHQNGKPRAGRGGWPLDMKNFPNKHLPPLTEKDAQEALGLKNGDFKERFEHLLNPPACTACPFYMKVRGSHYCGVKLCYDRKMEAWTAQKLEDASRQLKIPVYQESDGTFQVLESYRDQGLFTKGHAGLRLISKSVAKNRSHQHYFYQSSFKGIDDDLFLVAATGDALQKLTKGSGEAGSRVGKKSEKEKAEMRMMRVYRMRRKELLWEFTAVSKAIFDAVPIDIVNKLKCWHFVGVDDAIPEEWKTGKRETAEIKANFERRELVWALTHDVCSHYRRRSMEDILKDLQKHATEWGVKIPKTLIKQAEAWDAEIKASAAGKNGRVK
jgi:ParB/RepB/Spo0J family partition protein